MRGGDRVTTMLVSTGKYPYPVKPSGRPDNDALRHWGSAHGHPTMWRGPIPQALYRAFRDTYARQIEKAPLVKAIEI